MNPAQDPAVQQLEQPNSARLSTVQPARPEESGVNLGIVLV